MKPAQKQYKISGHETFALRYAWLPKCVKAVSQDPHLFSNEDDAMVTLGVGKNMVRSIRFWGEMTGVIEPGPQRSEWQVSAFGKTLLDPSTGLDPFLEDDQTLWLLHWKLSTRDEPLLAWDFLLNHWHESDLLLGSLIPTVRRELEKAGTSVSGSSLKSHFMVFFHTYCPTPGKKTNPEESLDSPFVELDFVSPRTAKRLAIDGKLETVFSIRRGQKPEIGKDLFLYCVLDFWQKQAENEKTITLRQLAYTAGSPGQIFKLDERDLRARLESMPTDDTAPVRYIGASLIQSLHRDEPITEALMDTVLKGVYGR